MDLDSLDLKKLRAFYLVARHGNLRLAAARLKQTVPAISSKLRRLEDELGVELFERMPNRLILTPAGIRFLVEVEAVFDRAEQALASLTSKETPAGRISISIGSDHSWYFAPKLSQFLKLYPSVELSLQVYRASDAVQALLRGELDIAIGIFPKLPKTLEQETIVESSLSLACAPGHPLLKRGSAKLADIARERLILLPKHAETRKLVDKALDKTAVKEDSVIEVANCQTASVFVQEGVGVAIVHSLCMAHAKTPNVEWVDLGQHFGKVAFSVVYRRGATRSVIIAALIEQLSKD